MWITVDLASPNFTGRTTKNAVKALSEIAGKRISFDGALMVHAACASVIYRPGGSRVLLTISALSVAVGALRVPAADQRGLQGRVLFHLAPACYRPDAVPWLRLQALKGVDSIRAVIFHHTFDPEHGGSEEEITDATKLSSTIFGLGRQAISLADGTSLSACGWGLALDLVAAAGRVGSRSSGKSDGIRVHVRCRRSGQMFESGIGQQVKGQVANHLHSKLGWMRTSDREQADLEVHIVLYDGGVLVEVPLLVSPRKGKAERGLKSAESWAMAKTLDIQPGHLVVDPMAGSAVSLCLTISCFDRPFRAIFHFHFLARV